MQPHVFHTKHDFSPDLAWAAFCLLAQRDTAAPTAAELQQMAQVTASPLARRADLHKLLSSMQELGLVERQDDGYQLSEAGECLASHAGRSETGFRAAVHCLYSWKWLGDARPNVATPSWSYRTVCREILTAGVTGVEQDELVLRVVDAARCFGAEKVSFSRSSVHGVAMWLQAQAPSLITRKGSRIFAALPGTVSATSAQFHLTALCRTGNGQSTLNSANVRLLAESWLVSSSEVMRTVEKACEFPGFDLIPSSPPHLLCHPKSSSLAWIASARSAQPFVAAES